MKKVLLITGVMLIMAVCCTSAGMSGWNGDPTEVAAIKTACLDYVEGFYEADTARMAGSVHPDLAKRQNNGGSLVFMDRKTLLDVAARGKRDKPEITVDVLDIYKDIAAAKVTSDYIDYCQLGKISGKWQVVNVLWVFK